MPHKVTPIKREGLPLEEYRVAPFIVQAANTDQKIFRRVLDEGVDIQETGFIGFNKRKAQVVSNALGCALFHANIEMAQYILQEIGIEDAKPVGINEKCTEFIDSGDRNKPLITNLEYSGMTPLLLAALLGDSAVEIVDFLIKLKADLKAVDSNGNSVLHLIAKSNAVKIYELLKRRGGIKPDLEARNKSGESPISIAEKSKLTKIRDAFLKDFKSADQKIDEVEQMIKKEEEEKKKKEERARKQKEMKEAQRV